MGRERAYGGVVGGVLAVMVGVLGVGRSGAQGGVLPLLPTSVAYDAAGNLYFADTNRQEVFESSLAGALTVVAGDGVQGFGGDGGPADGAELNSPEGVAVGADGTVYIADTGNGRIRAVRGGVIRTFAGTGGVGFGGDGGSAANAVFRGPNAVAIDASGAVLVCDAGNQRVRRISGGVITTVVGNGVQGFGGDGGPAAAAEIDTPMGLAVAGDGRMFVADSHNDRIRVVGTDGVIGTFAGSGVRGFAGDGGTATAAELSLPRGLVVAGGGEVIFADSNNQRIRRVSAGGTISTIVGSGVQGATSEGGVASAAGLNTPRGVAMSMYGAPTYADALNHLVRESVANGNVYVPAGMAAGRVSVATLAVNAGGAAGQVSAVATVMGPVGTPAGAVQLWDGQTMLAQTTLAGGTATFAPQTLTAGTHSLSVAYGGDGVNPSATSGAVTTTVGAVNTTAVVTAVANSQSAVYGAGIPVLTGTLSGVPAQDVGSVTVVFTTTAAAMSAPGSYPIVAALRGPASAKYSVVMGAGSGSVVISQAGSVTVEQPLAQGSYAGLPLVLTANVSSTTQGVPTGMVQFFDGTTMVATGTVVNGVATGTYLAPAAGVHSIVASYGGDVDFGASSSMVQMTSVGAMPSFTMASAGSATQTVAAGSMANYTMTVGAQSGAFTGVVDLSASGLPAGATAVFSPPQVVPGTSAVTVAMTVQTAARAVARGREWGRYGGVVMACLAVPLVLLRRRRHGVWRAIAMGGAGMLLMSVVGCGARTIATAVGGKTYTVKVTGTATNLVGAVVSQSTTVTLVVLGG